MTEDKPAIAIVPYGKWPNFGLRNLSLDALKWPLGRPDRLSSGTVADMSATDHLITFPRNTLFWMPRLGVRAKVSLMIVEPDSIHAHHIRNAERFHSRFHRILTRSRPLISRIKNGVFFVLGFTFIDDPNGLDRTKTKMCSLIASKRNDLEGHKLRHRIADLIVANDLAIDVMGRGYKAFENKADGLAPYRFSIVIENSSEDAYFTEKLIDALICETIPIYWGAPDIAEFFDPDGMLICNSENDIMGTLENLSDEAYFSRLRAIEENRNRAMRYADFYRHAAQTLRNAL